MNIDTVEQRNQVLHDLYRNKELLEFLKGKEWWDKEIYNIHWDWMQGGSWTTVDKIDVEVAVICWADTYGYLGQEQ